MNNRRGLFRVWIVASVIWSAVILIVALFVHQGRYGSFIVQGGNYHWFSTFWTDWLAVIFVPWVWVIWWIGISVIGWVARGFHSN